MFLWLSQHLAEINELYIYKQCNIMPRFFAYLVIVETEFNIEVVNIILPLKNVSILFLIVS